jgi:glycosyltransferase involved in cell wall biosynthesis
MIDGPLISVIMPVYNAERFVSKAIDSIINQTYKNWELLICDDASTDGSLTEIEKFTDQRIRLYRNAKNVGSLLTRNFLFTKIRGSLIALQDADDLSLPERLSRQASLFEADVELALCGTWARYVRGNETVKVKETPVSWSDIKEGLDKMNCFCSASIMFRNSLLDSTGPYRDFFRSIGNYDYDLTARIAQAYQSVNIPEHLYVVTVRPDSNSKMRRLDYPLKFESDQIVKALIKEREMTGCDSLDTGDVANMQMLVGRLLAPYASDPWLVYDKALNDFIELKFYRQAFNIVVKSILKGPFSQRPYKLLLYTLKRVLV